MNAFSALTIGGMKISGRIVRSATNEGGCDEGGRPLAVMETCQAVRWGSRGCSRFFVRLAAPATLARAC